MRTYLLACNLLWYFGDLVVAEVDLVQIVALPELLSHLQLREAKYLLRKDFDLPSL